MEVNESANLEPERRERYTHYPVPSDGKVSKELEMTLEVDIDLYSHAPRP